MDKTKNSHTALHAASDNDIEAAGEGMFCTPGKSADTTEDLNLSKAFWSKQKIGLHEHKSLLLSAINY